MEVGRGGEGGIYSRWGKLGALGAFDAFIRPDTPALTLEAVELVPYRARPLAVAVTGLGG